MIVGVGVSVLVAVAVGVGVSVAVCANAMRDEKTINITSSPTIEFLITTSIIRVARTQRNLLHNVCVANFIAQLLCIKIVSGGDSIKASSDDERSNRTYGHAHSR